MRKIYFLLVVSFASLAAGAQTEIDISGINEEYTTTFEEELVIDVATTASAVADPKLSFENPFKGQSFSEAEIAFDVYNYHGSDSIKVLGSLLAIYDADLGRMYFTNGSYLGFNDSLYVDANLIDYGLDTDFIGGNSWKNIKLQFTNDGFAVYVDNSLAFDQNSTDVTIDGDLEDYSRIITFLQEASTLVIGTGSWWSDNTRDDGSYWDVQYSYMKNITFTPDFSETTSIGSTITENKGKLVHVEYFTVSGIKVSADYHELQPGIYIKRAVFSNGATETTKILKTRH